MEQLIGMLLLDVTKLLCSSGPDQGRATRLQKPKGVSINDWLREGTSLT